MIQIERVQIGLSLAFVSSVLYYLDLPILLLICVQTATLYDCVHFHKKNSGFATGVLIFVTTFLNGILYVYYLRFREDLVHLVAIVQISDVFQYIGGTYFGKHKLQSISPTKTYEGYFISLLMLGYPYRSSYETLFYLGMGIFGGLINSSVKRHFQMKDFSNLLGSHGGWLDRADSIYLTVLADFFRKTL